MNKKKIMEAMPTALFITGVVGIFVSEVLTIRATAKAKDILTKERTVLKPGEDPDKVVIFKHMNDKGFEESQQIVVCESNKEYIEEVIKATWKPFVLPAFTTALTISSLIASHHLTRRQVLLLSTAAASAGTLVQRYREEIKDRVGEETLSEIDTAVAEATMKDTRPVSINTPHLTSGESFDTNDDGEYLFFDPFTKLKFRSTKLAVSSARYYLNRNFAIGGTVGLEMFYGFLGLEIPEEFRCFEWDIDRLAEDMDMYWIDIDFVKSTRPDPETGEYYYILEYYVSPDEALCEHIYPFGNPLISEGSVAI